MKIPKAVQEPTGMWYIRLRVRNAEGEMMSYAIREETEKKAVDKALALKAGLKAETVEAKRKMPDKTLRQAIDEYIARRSNVLSPSTIRGYRIIQQNRFRSVMDKRVAEIKDWQEVVNEEAALCAPKTLKNAWRFVKSVLMENGMEISVALPPVPKAEKKWLTPEQCLTFVDAVKGRKCEIGALLALHGLRRSEIYGLTWNNVDLENGLLRIRGAVVLDDKNAPASKKTNKNKTSARTVKIMIPALTEALKAAEKKEGCVSPSSLYALYDSINKVCRRAKLPEVGVHGLRHSFASLCYHLGISEMETMQRGGWSNVSTVHEIYTHISEADTLDADRKLSEFFKNAK